MSRYLDAEDCESARLMRLMWRVWAETPGGSEQTRKMGHAPLVSESFERHNVELLLKNCEEGRE